MKKLQRVVPVLQDKGDCEDVPYVIRFSFHTLSQLGNHTFRAFYPGLDLDNVYLNTVPAVEDQTSLFRIRPQRLFQFMKKSGNLDKCPLRGLAFGEMSGIFPVVIV